MIAGDNFMLGSGQKDIVPNTVLHNVPSSNSMEFPSLWTGFDKGFCMPVRSSISPNTRISILWRNSGCVYRSAVRLSKFRLDWNPFYQPEKPKSPSSIDIKKKKRANTNTFMPFKEVLGLWMPGAMPAFNKG